MSTALHDFASAAFVASGLNPDTQTSPPTGSAIDMISADGPCFAMQHVGAFSADTTLAGRIEQSATGTSGWTTIAGATFADVTAANNVQVIRFMRTAALRPLRGHAERSVAVGQGRRPDRRAEEDAVTPSGRVERRRTLDPSRLATPGEREADRPADACAVRLNFGVFPWPSTHSPT